NFLEENQELDWQVRQWVKLHVSENDMSDLAPLGAYTTGVLGNCVDTSNVVSTLVDGSFVADEQNDYLGWETSITLPLNWTDDCTTAYGALGKTAMELGRNNVTFTLKYSMVRATPTDKLTYQTMAVD